MDRLKSNKQKVIGILGGMGPEAGLHFCDLILRFTPAKKDQEHIPVILWSNPKIPHRTEFIIGKGENPLPYLIEGAEKLKKFGADFLVMPCVTAHYFYKKIIEKVKIPFLHIVEETRKYQKTNYPSITKIGFIASSGTIKSRIFQKHFNDIVALFPDSFVQEELVTRAIFGEKGIKAGYKKYPKKLLTKAGENLIKKGAECLVLGCTETSLVLKEKQFDVPLLDPLTILARKSVEYSMGQFITIS